MSDILIASVPVHGHVSPLLPLARHLVARGDRVRFLTGRRFVDAVRATGAEHISLPPSADFDDRTVVSQFPERERLSPVKAIAFDFEHIFVRPSEAQYEAVTELIASSAPDALVCDPLFLGAAVLVEKSPSDRIPVVVAGIVPLNLPGPGIAPYGLGLLPKPGLTGRLRNAVLRAVTRGLFRPVEAAAHDVARRCLGRPLSGPVLDWLPRADVVCQLTVPAFEYPRPDTDGRLVFTGPLRAETSDAPLPDWWDDLDASRPLVHVTQGTIANDDLGDLVLPTLQALAEDDVTVIVTTGGTPVSALGRLPANARAAEYLPYDELFARTDVFVTNGGYGGAQFALRHGVPMVVAPGKEDKVEVAARIAWSGTGIRLRSQHPSPDEVRHAVRTVLSEPDYRRAAERLSGDIATSSGAHGFAAAIDATIASRPGQRRTRS